MVRKIPRDCSIPDWAANPSVEVCDEFSFLKEGYFNTGLFIPISQNRRVCFSLHRLYAEWKHSDLFRSSQFLEDLSSPLEEISDAIIFTGPENHWHFTIDGLANLSEALLNQCDLIYVDQGLSDDQVGFLKLYAKSMGKNNLTVRKLSKRNYFIRNAYIPTNRPFNHKISKLKSCLGKLDNIPSHSENNKRIYVTRKGSKTRRLLNEDELISMLSSEFGFRSIQNEEYSLIEQLSLYKNSETVMGPHGAGLTNIVFSDNSNLLIEMYNSFQQPFYVALTKALDIRYLGIEGTVASLRDDEGHSDNAPFSVDVTRVNQALREVLNP